MLSVNPVVSSNINSAKITPFRKQALAQQEQEDDNPISRKGETMNLIKATFIGGIILGAKLMFELVDDGEFVLETLGNISKKTADKRTKELENAKKNIRGKRALYGIGAFVALLAAGLCGFAILYTAYNAPKIAYKSKINTFQKGKEMDVYVKANAAERDLYEQIDQKAQGATQEEKDALKVQYLKLANAKNQVPDYVKLKDMPKIETKN